MKKLNHLHDYTRKISKHKNTSLPEGISQRKLLLKILQPYHEDEKDILITVKDSITALEETLELIRTISFDTQRVSQSAA